MILLQFPPPTRGSKLIDRLASDPGLRNKLREVLIRWLSSCPHN